MREMIRKDREVTDINEILAIIDKCKVIHLGFCDEGQVYIVPMNFGYRYEKGELTFYFHGALRGRKYDIIRQNNQVGFEMECDVVPYAGELPCQYGTEFASVIGNGVASMIEDPQEKIAAMKQLMKTQTGKDFTFSPRLVSVVNVFQVKATEFSCKRRLHGVPGEKRE